MTTRQMALGLFIFPTGHHVTGWRHPGASWRGMEGFAPYREAALAAERARYDYVFLADALGPIDVDYADMMAWLPPVSQMDPLTVMTALASVTSRIGLIATISSTFNDPYHVARKLASLDVISGGRAGWNLVTSNSRAEAAHFGMEDIPPPNQRYERAEEFADIVFDLWESMVDGALCYDQATGRVLDFDHIRISSHEGRHLRVRGPLDVMRPAHGRPVTVQAGTSAPGVRLAARVADVVFNASPTREIARSAYARLKQAVSDAGRSPDACRVMPGLMPIVGTSRQHAQDIAAGYTDSVTDDLARVILQRAFGGALPQDLDLSAPPPAELFTGTFSRVGLLERQSRQQELTSLELARSLSFARGHHFVTGTAQDVADVMEDWFIGGCADGFNIMPASFMNGLTAFNDGVIPELRRRGLFRHEYGGTTMRENLGLPTPIELPPKREDA